MNRMADEVKARPVSGEIMAAPAGRSAFAAGPDIIDAEFETIAPALHEPRTLPGSRPAGATMLTPAGMDVLKGTPPVSKVSRGGPFFWAFGIALAACAFWVSGGHALVPAPADLPEVTQIAALRIAEVTSTVIRSAGKPVLQVEGAAINDGQHPAVLPGIEIRVTGNDGRTTRYNLGTSDRPLPAGGRFDFSSRLEVPKDGVKSVLVSLREDADASGEGQGH